MSDRTWQPEQLEQAVWWDALGAGVGAEQPGGVALAQCLSHAEKLGGEVNGLAYTTTGAYSVRRAGPSGVFTVMEQDGQAGSREHMIDLDTVFELRLWRVIPDEADDGVLAHELRWLNDSGAAEIVVGSRVAVPEGRDCWVRRNSYLQHGNKGDIMTGIEVFTVEDRFGNTVFADELMTGRWG